MSIYTNTIENRDSFEVKPVSNSKVYTPSHFVFLRKEQNDWFVIKSKTLMNASDLPVLPVADRVKQYGYTLYQLTIECFRHFLGRDGYYIVDLKQKKYYYCGQEGDSIKQTVKSLGICLNFNGQ